MINFVNIFITPPKTFQFDLGVAGKEILTLSALYRSCQFLPLSDRTSWSDTADKTNNNGLYIINSSNKQKCSSRWLGHRIRIHRRATRVGAFEVFEAAHVALRTLLAFSQPVNCIFWPIGMLNWLVAASKLHKHRVTCCTAEWPFYSFLILWLGY